MDDLKHSVRDVGYSGISHNKNSKGDIISRVEELDFFLDPELLKNGVCSVTRFAIPVNWTFYLVISPNFMIATALPNKTKPITLEYRDKLLREFPEIR